MAPSYIVTPAVQHDVSFGCLIWNVLANLTQLFPSRESIKHFRYVKLIISDVCSVGRAATLVQQGEIFRGRNTLVVGSWRDNFLFWSLGWYLG